MIFLEPNYGLANRMRVIASGIELGTQANEEVFIVWPKSFELNCFFSDLYEPIENLKFIDKGYNFKLSMTSNQPTSSKRMLAHYVNKLIGIDFCIKEDDGNNLKKHSEFDAFNLVSSYDNVYIKTCGRFTDDDSTFSKFKPIPELRDKIENRVRAFSSNTIGLHIRRTDHVNSIQNSPLELFIKMIRLELTKNSDTSFYLSTDDFETEKQLKSLYPEAITTYDKDFSRNSIQGIKDAVVDMFCLANTKKIYGSFDSSFSDVASKINLIPLQIMKGESALVTS